MSPLPESAVTFRPAAPGDRALLTRLITEYYTHDAHEIDPAVIASALDAALGGDIRIAIEIIERDGTPVGYMALTTGFSIEAGGPDSFVDEIYIEPAHRGRGIGTLALRHADASLRAMGARRVYLEVEKHNPRAKALYESLGYEETGRHLMSKWVDRPTE